jgi:RNA transcription, translation and transport factor protein
LNLFREFSKSFVFFKSSIIVTEMLRNKLLCLEHPNADVNVKDEKQFRNLVLWLEDQKIRNYKIEDRAELRKVNSAEWPKVFDKYKNDLNCPKELISSEDQLRWIVAYAIKLEYSDNGEQFPIMLTILSLFDVFYQLMNTER